MKAVFCHKYGSPLDLVIKEIDEPRPKKYEVRIKVVASAVNDYDWSLVRGKPFLYRLMFGIKKPKNPIPGMEVAGIIEAVGAGVARFKVGDAVFGDTSEFGFGCLAEEVCINQDAIIHKPGFISFEDAVCVPHAGLLAWQGFQKAELKENQKVLINGAGGGVGTFALYLAKAKGCHVAGVDRGEKLKTLLELGYDEVIDYKRQDFTRINNKYDVILDCKTTRGPIALKRALSSDGKYVTVGGNLGTLLKIMLFNVFFGRLSRKKVSILSLKPNHGLETLLALFKDGKIKTQIDGPHPLSKVPELIQYFGLGKHQGKIVVKP